MWWLSFCDPDRPSGSQFLGASIVGPADNILEASKMAHLRCCNPGGEVMGARIPQEKCAIIPEAYLFRLLSRSECEEFDAMLEALESAGHGRKGDDDV